MKKVSIVKVFVLMLGVMFISNSAMAQSQYITKTGHVKFFSHTPVEDIQAHNYKITSRINAENGDIVFSVPMQSFEFEKSLMQKHFNKKKFLSTKKFPKAKFKGNIAEMKNIDLSKDGEYKVMVEGDLTIRGESNHVKEDGTLIVKDGKLSSRATFNIVLADYGIAFKKGKPSKNIGKSVEITVELEF